MKVRIRNLGILKQAEFSLGDLTIICGENNTGKTYAAHTLYGFLDLWHGLIECPLSDAQIQHLLTHQTLTIWLGEYVESAQKIVDKACEEYSEQIGPVFSEFDGMFDRSKFHIRISQPDILNQESDFSFAPNGSKLFTCSKRKGEDYVTVILKKVASRMPKKCRNLLNLYVSLAVVDIVFSNSFPTPFISSSERTGTVVFRKDLSFVQERLIEQDDQSESSSNSRELLDNAYDRYPRPIANNAEFISQLEDITGKQPSLAKKHPELPEEFAEIIGGDYGITQNGKPYYIPKGTKVNLMVNQCSGAVRSLFHMGFYLRHVARKGDLLMVDEPELNLHPANQRRIARLFARLVNLGVKVFITTHSDYIIKELNTLIMLNHDKPHLKRIAQENGYRQSELICSDQVKVYMAREELMPLEEGQKRRRRGHTLVEADIDPVLGIEAPSFDQTIDDMNKIVEDIVWGAE